MLPRDQIEAALRLLPAPPTDGGKVAAVVARAGGGRHLLPERARLTPEGGVEGDRWSTTRSPKPGYQVSLMRADVARALDPEAPVGLSGDNLLVELDLSPANLPVGTRLRIGSALCEVTPEPHTGCGLFEARFGPDARAITLDPAWAGWRLRGLFVRVLEPGEVAPGDPIRVLHRPGA